MSEIYKSTILGAGLRIDHDKNGAKTFSGEAHLPTTAPLYVVAFEPLKAKIDRYLQKLIPTMHLLYVAGSKDYYVRILNPGQPDHLGMYGPYYYDHMVGLARMLNAVSQAERQLPAIWLKVRGTAQPYAEQPLPRHLRFAVITPALRDALEQLRKDNSATATVPEPEPATATVTAPEVADPAEEYDETLGFDIDPETGEVTAR